MASNLSTAIYAACARCSQRELAELTGISQGTISRLASEDRRIDASTLRALCTNLPPPVGLEVLIGHLRDEIQRAGRSQAELVIAPPGKPPTDYISTLASAAADDEELRALLIDLAKMVEVHVKRLEAATRRPLYPTTDPDESHLAAAEDQAPYGTPKNEP
jgi:transcriptional regulator with XRE-family HTH domain